MALGKENSLEVVVFSGTNLTKSGCKHLHLTLALFDLAVSDFEAK